MGVTNINEEFGESWTWMTQAWSTLQLLAPLSENLWKLQCLPRACVIILVKQTKTVLSVFQWRANITTSRLAAVPQAPLCHSRCHHRISACSPKVCHKPLISRTGVWRHHRTPEPCEGNRNLRALRCTQNLPCTPRQDPEPQDTWHFPPRASFLCESQTVPYACSEPNRYKTCSSGVWQDTCIEPISHGQTMQHIFKSWGWIRVYKILCLCPRM